MLLTIEPPFQPLLIFFKKVIITFICVGVHMHVYGQMHACMPQHTCVSQRMDLWELVLSDLWVRENEENVTFGSRLSFWPPFLILILKLMIKKI